METEPPLEQKEFLLALFREGRFQEAEDRTQALVTEHPISGFVWLILGLSRQNLQKDAFFALQRAVKLRPGDAIAHYHLGIAEQQLGRLERAIDHYRRVIELDPNHVKARYNMGVGLQSLECLEEAINAYQETINLQPNCIEALNNLAMVFNKLGRSEDAINGYLNTLLVDPGNREANIVLHSIYMNEKRLIDAEALCLKALDIDPNFAEMHEFLADSQAYLSNFKNVVSESDRAFSLHPNHPVLWEERLYSFSYHPDLSAEDIFQEFVRWGDRFPDPKVDFAAHDRDLNRRLRIGYVSPDFRNHSSRFYFLPLFTNHDRDAFEFFAYSNVAKEDSATHLFKRQFDHWRDIRGLNAEESAQLIRKDNIDILVDLCNHMEDQRLDVFALKPAPIQATWLGAAWTTGLKTVDYVLFDPVLAPEGTLARESIVRLPHSFLVFQPPERTATIVPAPCLKNGYVTFGYTGRTERLNHRTFRVWGEILNRLPKARLILDYGPFADPKTQAYYLEFLGCHGVDTSRVIMRKSANIFEGLNDIDILLDSFPHSGGTMLMDAFWMGVPAVTLASRPPLGRLCASMLTNLGLPEWIASTEEEYTEKVCGYASQPQALNELRIGLRECMKNSPLMDGPGFARGVEAAYRTMFERWAKEAPHPQGETIQEGLHQAGGGL